MRHFIYSISILLTLVWVGCDGHDKEHTTEQKTRIFPQYNPVLDEIIKKPEGTIRGIDLNTKAETIQTAEGMAPLESDSSYLYFEYKIDSVTDYSVTYNLQHDTLDEIEVQVNCTNLDLSTKIFNDLKTYYEKKLPNPTEDKGYVVYNCFEGQRKPFVVSLTDNSTPNKGIINLVIYRDK